MKNSKQILNLTLASVGLALVSTSLLSTFAFAQTNVGIGNDTVIPSQVSEGRNSTDIRYQTTIGNTYHYVNGKANPAVTLKETNPAQSDTNLQDSLRLTKSGDTFTFIDKYELEVPDTQDGTLSYGIKLFCTSGCSNVSDVISVDKIVHRWSSKDSDKLDKSQEVDPKKSVAVKDDSLNVSITPFDNCNSSELQCQANTKINTENNSAGQFGWVSVIFKLNKDISDTPIVIDGFSTVNYSAFGSANGNSLRMIIGAKSNDAGLPSKEKVVTEYASPDQLDSESSSSVSSSVSSSEQPNLPKTGGDEKKSDSNTSNSWVLPTVLGSVALAVVAFAGYKFSNKKKS